MIFRKVFHRGMKRLKDDLREQAVDLLHALAEEFNEKYELAGEIRIVDNGVEFRIRLQDQQDAPQEQ